MALLEEIDEIRQLVTKLQLYYYMEYLFRNRQNMKFLIAKNPKLRSAFKFHKNLQESSFLTIFQSSKYMYVLKLIIHTIALTVV